MATGLLDKSTGLTVAEDTFARLVITGMSQAEAYRIAFPKARKWKDTAVYPEASTLAAQPKVRARIAQLQAPVLKKFELKLENAIQEIMRIAYVDPNDLFTDVGTLKPISEIDPATRAAIASIEVVELFEWEGEGKNRQKVWVGYAKKVKLNDKNQALDKLMKHLGGYLADNEQKATALQELMDEIAAIGRGLPAARRQAVTIDNESGDADE
jgi:phage terminase small subunit